MILHLHTHAHHIFYKIKLHRTLFHTSILKNKKGFSFGVADTFDGFGGRLLGIDSERKEREPVARNRVMDFLRDFRDGDKLVGEAVKLPLSLQ